MGAIITRGNDGLQTIAEGAVRQTQVHRHPGALYRLCQMMRRIRFASIAAARKPMIRLACGVAPSQAGGTVAGEPMPRGAGATLPGG